jgi:hypothetical protein
MINNTSPKNDEKTLRVRRGRVDSVDLYEVKENELELLENGSPATLQLNFAIFLFSMALTCIIAIATTNFKWQIVESIFTFASIIGILMGAYLIMSWWRTRTSISSIIKVIKNRINHEEFVVKEEDNTNKPSNDVISDEIPSE